MGRNSNKSSPPEVTNNDDNIIQNCANSDTPSPVITQSMSKPRQSKSSLRRQLKKLLKCFTSSCPHRRQPKKRKHVKVKENKNDTLSSFFTSMGNETVISPSTPNDFQLHWFRNSKHSILSYALSKLAFFSRLSKEKLKDNVEPRTEKIVNVYSKNNGNLEETVGKVSHTTATINDQILRERLIRKILLEHSSSCPAVIEGDLRKVSSPQQIYRRNLKMFETLVAITVSSSSSSTSRDSVNFLNEMPKPGPTITSSITPPEQPSLVSIDIQCEPVSTDVVPPDKPDTTVDLPDENKNTIIQTDDNQNPLKCTLDSKISSSGSQFTDTQFPPRRIITTSRNRVEVDVYFMDWIKTKIGLSTAEPPPTTTTVGIATASSSTASIDSKLPDKPDKNNNPNTPPGKHQGTFRFLRRGEGRRASVGGRNANNSKSRGRTGRRSDDTTSTARTATTTTASTRTTAYNPECEKCGPCAGKGALSGAPPAYLDYGESGAANTSGEAWKGKRKGDPVMDRLKNVDIVEEMTYLVPNPDCCGSGNGDGCEDLDGAEEDDCDYYAMCESCGEMEPVPEELKRELAKKRKKKKGEVDSTPVTYSRRQRFNFKNKGDMCDEDEGPPYPYEGLQCCPGQGCRCSCCVAGLRRNPECTCKCCQTMGPARKCNSFDEIPVGKNPQIRRILCPEEECAKIREHCKTLLPDTPGMYKFDVKNQIFERQVPRTPTPIVLEVEAPKPLTKQQLLALGREVQEKNRLGIGVDAYCRPVEQDPMYLPPVYGQCNPPVCGQQPCCQPCCAPNNSGQDPNQKTSTGSGYSYSYENDSKYYYTPSYSRTANSALTKTITSKGYYTDTHTPTKTTKTSMTQKDENNNFPIANNKEPTFETKANLRREAKTSSSESLPFQ